MLMRDASQSGMLVFVLSDLLHRPGWLLWCWLMLNMNIVLLCWLVKFNVTRHSLHYLTQMPLVTLS